MKGQISLTENQIKALYSGTCPVCFTGHWDAAAEAEPEMDFAEFVAGMPLRCDTCTATYEIVLVPRYIINREEGTK